MGSSLSGDLTGFSLANDVAVSLGFKSTQNEGIILQDKQTVSPYIYRKCGVLIATVWDCEFVRVTFFYVHQANGIQLALESGYVTLTFNEQTWKSSKQYQDGQWHFLTATRRNGR